MVKAVDIIKQLQIEIPQHSNRFTTQLSLSSLTAVGSTVTAVTAVDHGLVNGNFVNISGALVQNPISALTSSGDIASAETSFDHDLTENFDILATVEGATEPEYNVTGAELLQESNRRNFKYQISGGPASPATGSPILLESRVDGYNGLFDITKINDTSFTYELASDPPGLADTSNAVANTSPRISGAVDLGRAQDSYTKQAVDDDYWLFVVLEDAQISRDRSLLNDGTSSISEGTDRRIRTIRNFNVYMVAPAVDEISALIVRDTAEDVALALYKSLCGFLPPSGLSDKSKLFVSPTGHGFEGYTKAVYFHRFEFQVFEDILGDDMLQSPDRAFRDARLKFLNEFDEAIINTNIDMDDVPL